MSMVASTALAVELFRLAGSSGAAAQENPDVRSLVRRECDFPGWVHCRALGSGRVARSALPHFVEHLLHRPAPGGRSMDPGALPLIPRPRDFLLLRTAQLGRLQRRLPQRASRSDDGGVVPAAESPRRGTRVLRFTPRPSFLLLRFISDPALSLYSRRVRNVNHGAAPAADGASIESLIAKSIASAHAESSPCPPVGLEQPSFHSLPPPRAS